MSLMLALLIPTLAAGDIYVLENADGTISFTDTPTHSGYTRFYVDGPPPLPRAINYETFPLLDSFDVLILNAEARFGVDAALIKAVCLAESGMNPNAVSRSGAQGLMQLMPGTAAELGVTDPFDPEQSINGGARYLARMIDEFGDLRRSVAAYNAGPGNVRKYHGVPPFEETRIYVPRVLALYDVFRYDQPI